VRGIDQHFYGRQPLLVLADHQSLRHDRIQVMRQIHEQLLVLILREHVDDTVESLGCVVGVQGGNAQVTRASQGDRRLHGLPIPDLTDHDNVRRLTHRALERAGIGLGIQAQLTLVDDGLFVGMQELDRLLDRDDVIGGVLVTMVDHRRDGRGLS